ncbi:hypothetical protein M378DRAFT_110253 [Amanita muscaria Koide BX008]|uniref:Integrase core domain-containing protein n=1 Tax=Amanita muscaria (strain Koide BX008) TaxID=946122 RepID=A0A0C2WFX7_AMAMK|nr:hypothetical protein M378DRAFT_110253 [Amanita muscaria Koide BX008]
MARLEQDFGLHIGRRKLFILRKDLGLPSVRKNPTTAQDRAQAVIDIKAHDLTGRWGVAQVRQRLANKGVLLSRDECRSILHDHFDEEFDTRFIRSKGAIDRIPLNCLGPWHQIHCDGHEKLNSQALEMGIVTLPIYAFKDQFSTFVLTMQVLPNIRRVETIGHLYLDLAKDYGRIPLQLIMDMGTEVGDMIRAQAYLRSKAAPEFTENAWPSTVQVQSKKNTPIEGFWRWKRSSEGHNIREAILIGRNNGLFNLNDPLHVNTFNWLWPPLVQSRLDEFREYWNNHQLSSQKKKLLPSGTSPRQMWLTPDSVRADARDCSVVIEPETIQLLREGLGGMDGRAKAYSFVDPEFLAEADAALGDLNYPDITLSNAWDVFIAVIDILSR